MRDRRLLIVGIILIVVGIVGLVILSAMWAQWPWMHTGGYMHSGMMVPLGTFDIGIEPTSLLWF